MSKPNPNFKRLRNLLLSDLKALEFETAKLLEITDKKKGVVKKFRD